MLTWNSVFPSDQSEGMCYELHRSDSGMKGAPSGQPRRWFWMRSHIENVRQNQHQCMELLRALKLKSLDWDFQSVFNDVDSCLPFWTVGTDNHWSIHWDFWEPSSGCYSFGLDYELFPLREEWNTNNALWFSWSTCVAQLLLRHPFWNCCPLWLQVSLFSLAWRMLEHLASTSISWEGSEQMDEPCWELRIRGDRPPLAAVHESIGTHFIFLSLPFCTSLVAICLCVCNRIS